MRKFIILFIQLIFVLAINAQSSVKYATVDLNLRTAPNKSSHVIMVIPQGTPVTIDEDCNCKWIPIRYDGQIGYVSTKYLTKNRISYSGITSKAHIKHYTNSRGNRVQSPTRYNSAPEGATALCRDGSYSFSQSRRGTCSHHGGVARWL
ncbi:MAG: type 3 domain protein [Bacteroidetes bacterium]|nr:type 3 domain protein [Bacteroidota bacterium]